MDFARMLHEMVIDQDPDVEKVIDWYAGDYMGNDHFEGLKEIFTSIGKKYDKAVIARPLYRCTHLHHGAKTVGNKPILSWASTLAGAESFFHKYVVQINHRNAPEPNKQWAIISSTEPTPLASFEATMQYLRDEHKLHEFKFFNQPDMLASHEVICLTPSPLNFKIEKVLVQERTLA